MYRGCVSEEQCGSWRQLLGQGVSQNDPSVANDIRMDLSRMDWYAFNDNYGTSEEKALVAFIKDYMEKSMRNMQRHI